MLVALGNPGPRYAFTRHNIGWQVLCYLSFHSELQWKSQFKGQLSIHHINHNKLIILKPETYMNRSGISVGLATQYYDIDPEEILVVHDELELDFGFFGFKKGGGLAGHNGLRSITASMGTRDFYRFRMGISKPPNRNLTSYVTEDFDSKEQEQVDQFFSTAAKTLELGLTGDLDNILTEYKKKHFKDFDSPGEPEELQENQS